MTFGKKIMKQILILIACSLLSGCTTSYDSRLNGTWKSNREATVAEAIRNDPRWEEVSKEKRDRFEGIFGEMTLTYNNNEITSLYGGETNIYRYKLIQTGNDFCIIRPLSGTAKNQDCRIEFEADRSGYWIDCGHGFSEKFDKYGTEQAGPGYPPQGVGSPDP